MTGSPANTVWARSLLDELARAGLREVIVAPGSRSTPLVMAAAADDRLRVRVHLDERSCGFFALGVGKATARPAAVITTSGTAVANLYPSVVEASQAGVPLIVLSADRPHRLRGADANQAIDQVRIFGTYPRAFFELAEPTLDGRALGHLRGLAARAWASSCGHGAGPVHINVPFDKPLEPEEPSVDVRTEHLIAVGGRPDNAPIVRVEAARPSATDKQLQELIGRMAPRSGVIVAGPTEEAGCLGPEVRRFAA
ncbi:MAG: 2-succinyl-5-enolpyruvyl-6-hydroxy-3-cyclohexene-1-carboxylic-acid synthase, partial [Longimicrobiales bacterium]|nr:2-succinyl-5-enolpyruvyl-6-hydroxy-3-cyclohexene-1-carboxylic-acid synthase [Longimicrobiales bacterium]